MNYKDFDVHDFLNDEYFRKWIYQPDESSQAFWMDWLEKNPAKKPVVNEAGQILRSVEFYNHSVSEEAVNEVWSKIKSRNNRKPHMHRTLQVHRQKEFSVRRKWSLIGAAASMLIGALFLFYLLSDNGRYESYATAYGETQNITLPDHSIVTLNANSMLRFDNNWHSAGKRQVWLEGEAFFEVEKTQTEAGAKVPFWVHTNELEVEVVGTRFNVNARRGKTEVVLNSGKVKLHLENEKEPEIWMDPGDMVAFSGKDKSLLKKQVNSAEYSSWKSNWLVFNGTPLAEVKTLLEDNYGFEVRIQDESLLDRRFKGRFPSDKLELMLDALSASLGIQVHKEGKTIIINNP